MKLRDEYQKKIVPQLMEEFNLDNPLAVPRVIKVAVNVSLKEFLDDKKLIGKVSEELFSITGQKPKLCRAKKSVAGFKLRQGQPIGLMVTLRRNKMYAFLEKLFKITFPRIRDFQGVSANSFDHQGNYTLGLKEQVVFPEIDSAKIERTYGLEVTIVTNSKDDKKAKRLLELMGMFFKKDGEKK